VSFVPARNDGAFTPALSYGRKKQVEPIWLRKWIMHHQLGFILRHGMSLHIGKAARQARESKPELKATCENIRAF
jgi:hypothetical protein